MANESKTELSTEPTIDEQLVQANKAFDVRLAADAKAGRVAEGTRVRAKEPPKRAIPPKAIHHRVGAVAHAHFRETDFEIIEKDCLYVNHTVHDRKGFAINNKRYQGRVIVPQCVADYLSMMENRHQVMERGVFEDRGRRLNYGEIRG